MVTAIAALSIIDKELASSLSDNSPWAHLEGFRLNHETSKSLVLEFEKQKVTVDVTFMDGGVLHVSVSSFCVRLGLSRMLTIVTH